MTDSELLAYVKFCFDRFNGYVPEEKMLVNALADFRKSEMATAGGNQVDTLCQVHNVERRPDQTIVCATCGYVFQTYFDTLPRYPEKLRQQKGFNYVYKEDL